MINRAEDTWSQQTAASSTADLHAASAGAPAGGRPPEVTVKRRVSRVESLRNLFFNKGHPHDARRKFLLKKRTRSEEKEKVSINVYSGLKSKKVQFREAAFFASSKAKINLCLKFFSNEAALKGPKE